SPDGGEGESAARLMDLPHPSACTVIDTGYLRKMDVAIELPGAPLEAVMSNEVWAEVYHRLADLIEAHRTTLVFVNTRRMAERVTHHLTERLGDDKITSHHGSLSARLRLDAEDRLKRGELKALVATASLELGIDIGSVDLVCQLGSTRSIATLLQRVGRAEHKRGGLPKGRVFPLTRDELIECAALLRCVNRGELDPLTIPEKPLDVLAQQIVAAASTEDWDENDLFELVSAAWPYRNLTREQFDSVVNVIAEGFSTNRGRRSALLHHDAKGQPPGIPFWLGEGPARTNELSRAVSDFRMEFERRLSVGEADTFRDKIQTWLTKEFQVPQSAAEQITAYFADAYRSLGAIPSQQTLVMERFFDESGGMQLVLHAPFGSRINRAWGL